MSLTTNWEEAPKASELTLKKLNEICSEYKEKRLEKSKKDAELKEINKQLAGIEGKIIEYLSEYGMKGHAGDFGKITIREIKSVRQPATPEAREKFFEYLRRQGVFDEMISINSRTLASYVNQEIAGMESEGYNDWVPPGISKPEKIKKVSFSMR